MKRVTLHKPRGRHRLSTCNYCAAANELLGEELLLLGHHHLDELLVVDLAIAVNVGLADHLVDFLVRELLAW